MKKYLLFFSLIIFVTWTSCSDYDQFVPYEQASNDFAFLNALVPKVNGVQIDSKIENQITFSDSIFLDIPANAFVDNFGQNIDENVTVVFFAHNRASEFVADDISFTLNTNQLIGAGSLFFVGAYDGQGNSLKLADQKSITIKFPYSDVDEDLTLYFPVENINGIQDLKVWKIAESTNFSNQVFKESWTWQDHSGEVSLSNGYIIKADQLKWMGLGYDIVSESGVNLEVALPEGFTDENSIVFVKGITISSFEKLKWNDERMKFCHLENMIPLGSEIKILVLSKKEDRIYIDLHDYILHFDSEISAVPLKKDVDQILEIIQEF